MVHTCDSCYRNFNTLKGLNIHRSSCSRKKVSYVEKSLTNIRNVTNESIDHEIETAMITDMIIDTNELNIERVENIHRANIPSYIPGKSPPR